MEERSATNLTAEVYYKLHELYDTYRNKLKPIIFTVECHIKKFPVQVLIEIRSYQDHIANCFLDDKTETDCLNELNKAKSHLQRAIADCYKTLLQIYFPDTISFFHEQYKFVNLLAVNDGKFLPELTRLEGIAKEKTLSAKLNEFNENSHTFFEEAVLAYEDILIHIDNNRQGLANAENITKGVLKRDTKRENRRGWKFAFIGAILGAAGTLIIQNWNEIKLFFTSFFR